MGSSGAGKTTLMDVIAMRKTQGTVEGDVRLNGFPQDVVAFRRCSGYVEQFNNLTPELTVRETVLFSARLRLDVLKVPEDEKLRAFDRTTWDNRSEAMDSIRPPPVRRTKSSPNASGRNRQHPAHANQHTFLLVILGLLLYQTVPSFL